uniref:Major sperm protein n=1 Tax=Caenorhabditis japonica TaxID=281687 RepID=A0A8R1DIV8_CAEJA
MTLLTVALYLINGEHARVVSIALTSVPAAIFSYRVLSCHETKLEGYNSILSYWTVYGLLALIDQFVETSHGYQLGKTVFLSTVLAYAARHNDAAIPEAWKNMKTSGDKIMLNTIHSSFDSTRPRDEESLEYLFDFSNENVNTAHSFSDCIVTDPAHHVTFSEHQQEVEIRMTNVSQQRHVMFALKTNADTHLIAAPTSGILLSGQSMTIRVGVADDTVSNTARISIDKLAIDHVELPRSDEFSVFSPDFFKAQAKRSRHAIRVYYE